MARIYVGNLPMDMRDKDVEDIFYKYGRIRDVDLKTPLRPPAFAFVAFENLRDAEDAVRGRDGYDYEGSRLRVELARSGRDRGRGGFHQGGGGGGFRGPPPNARTSEHRVIITGLPPSASWQDLKDHMRKAGDVIYADVDHRGGGIVHYSSRSDMDYALRKLDESEFRNPFDRSTIRVLPPRGPSRRDSRSPRRRKRYSSSRSRSRSPDRRKRSSRSYSRSSRSSSRSRSRTPNVAPEKRGSDASASRDRMDDTVDANGSHEKEIKEDRSPYDDK